MADIRGSGSHEESTFDLLRQVPGAALRHGVAAIPLKIRHSCISVCGIVALICPLLLWISWSKLVFYIVMSTAFASLAILIVLIRFAPEDHY